MHHTAHIKQIHLEKIIAAKNPRLLKLLPPPLLSYIKRIVHQTEFNQFLQLTKNHHNHDFVIETLKIFDINVFSQGLENIPTHGGCIIACNHPLGGIDGIAVMKEVATVRKDQKALVNDILMNLENLSSLLIPVNKHGKNAIESVKRIDNAYASGECVIVFPAGLVSRRKSGVIKDLEWKKSFITKAIKYQLPVIPLHVDARNSNFFYNLASLRRIIGLKTNIEMFFLVDEVFKQKGKYIKLNIGKPIPYTHFSKNKPDTHWAQYVKEQVYKLNHKK